MAEQIKTTQSKGNLVGVLEEKDLQLLTNQTKKDKFGKEITFDLIKGKLVVNGVRVEVYVPSRWNSESDNIKNFKGAKTIMDEYVDKVMASASGKEADTINISCSYDFNEYADKEREHTVTGTKINFGHATRVDAKTPYQNEFFLDKVCIRSIKEEMKDEEPTGRLIVNAVGFDNNGKIIFYELFAENLEDEEGLETMANDFAENFEAGKTCRLDFMLKEKMVGKKKPSKGTTFGRKANVQEGYSITEALIIGGELPLEDDDEGAYKITDIKKAIEIHDNETVPEIIRKAIESDKKKNNTKGGGEKGLKGSKTKATIGKKANVEEVTEDDLPF